MAIKCNTKECAEFSNETLRDLGYIPYGNAWNIKNADIVFSGYNADNRPEEYNEEAVSLYNKNAADNVLKNFDSNTLDKNSHYIVNMYYNGSPYQKRAYSEGRDSFAGTHTGYLQYNNKLNKWEVIHNIHGTIHTDPFLYVQGSKGKYGVTAVLQPRKDSVFNNIRSVLGLGEGGSLPDTIEIKVSDKIYTVEVAKTQKERIKGLSNRDTLGVSSGMLFVFDEPQEVTFWMKDTKIPLDIIFIDEEEQVISVKHGTPMSEEPITENGVLYVLEVNANSGIKEGEEVDIDYNEVSEDDNKMKVLAPDGSVQMELEGGERIVSRRETKILIKKAKKAYQSKDNKDYKALGRYIFKVFKKQDNRDPEYVDSPK